MPTPEYDRTAPHQFGGAQPEAPSYADAAAVILPVPFERTTSYVPGTRYGPREILLASAQVEVWDEEMGCDVHTQVFTLPELDLSASVTM
jgi:agmatinase